MTERTTERSASTASTGGMSTASDRSGERSKPPITERIKDTISTAADEHRANAEAPRRPGRRASSSPRRTPRRARLRLTRVDPWSVMKASFLLSIAFGVVTFVAVFMIWTVLGTAGVWDSINATVASVVEGDNNASDFDVTNYLGMGRVLGFTLLVSIVDVILLTAIATLGAFLYNMAAALLGGIEVTLSEDDR